MSAAAFVRAAWSHLEAALEQPSHPWRAAALATTGTDGAAQVRWVVLRALEPGPDLVFHTDARAGKVAAIRAEPRVAWAAFDPTRRLQIRVGGRASIDTDPQVLETVLDALHPGQRAAYLGPSAPGDPIAAPRDAVPDPRRQPALAIVRVRVETVDVLALAEQRGAPLRRARATPLESAPEGWRATWVAP